MASARWLRLRSAVFSDYGITNSGASSHHSSPGCGLSGCLCDGHRNLAAAPSTLDFRA
ncbi:hypothetical protein [Streptomyces sp. NPDC058989]|uniref:hypothetical protein n=1 Tax=Streptomyces sp. NPDC058989 TaxID=3346686 RepID=UPI0036A89AD1